MKKKKILKIFLIFREIGFSSPKLKKLLILQDRTFIIVDNSFQSFLRTEFKLITAKQV